MLSLSDTFWEENSPTDRRSELIKFFRYNISKTNIIGIMLGYENNCTILRNDSLNFNTEVFVKHCSYSSAMCDASVLLDDLEIENSAGMFNYLPPKIF